jgi:hypothetical protein
LRKNIDFTAPNKFDDENIQIFLFSDCYIGLDQQYPVKLITANNSIIRKYNIKLDDTKIEVDTSYNMKSYIENNNVKDDEEVSYIEQDKDEQTDEDENIEEIIFDNW